jgi:hypothetical protein
VHADRAGRHRILDILSARYSHKLAEYFSQIDRSQTKHFVSDMWSTYVGIARHILKIPLMSLTDIITFVKYFGPLKPFARKNRKSSAKPEEFILNAPEIC